MADTRKDGNETIGATARATREAVDQTETVVRAGAETVQRLADEVGRAFGITGDSEELTRQATKNLEAVTETGSVLARGFQELSKEWFELAQQRLQKNVEGLTRLAQCRSLPDFAAVQSDLVRDNVQQIIDSTRQIAERSVEIANEAAQKIGAAPKRSTNRFSRAA